MHSLVENARQYSLALNILRKGSGSFAIDAERANRFRYDQEFPWVVQVFRKPSSCFIFDMSKLDNLDDLNNLIAEEEVVIHAAINDIKSLKRVGVNILNLFDTEIACRLLNIQRVNLSYALEKFMGIKLKKEYSTINWSARPLKRQYMQYAEDDVKYLIDLKNILTGALMAEGKLKIAQEEFVNVLNVAKQVNRPNFLEKFKGEMRRAIAQRLLEAREEIGRKEDVFVQNILSNKAIKALANQAPKGLKEVKAILRLSGRRFSEQYIPLWYDIVNTTREIMRPDADVKRGCVVPDPEKISPEKTENAQAATSGRGGEAGTTPKDIASQSPEHNADETQVRRDKSKIPDDIMELAKTIARNCAEKINVPVENLITTATLKYVLRSEITSPIDMKKILREAGLRNWQIANLQNPLFDGLFGSARAESQVTD